MKIFLGYKASEKPCGGANNFLRALYAELKMLRTFEIVNSPKYADVVFMNQLNAGEGRTKFRLDEILGLKRQPRSSGRSPRLVVRAVNLRCHSYGLGIRTWWEALRDDLATLTLLNASDFSIFQSNYQKEFFTRFGYNSPAYRIIHNGANPIFLSLPKRKIVDGQRIRLVSATTSPRISKRHDIIKAVADCKNVEVYHFGRWPLNLPIGNVRLMGVRLHEEMKNFYAEAHGFLHPAAKDPCPNAVIEALASGLPVLYGDCQGSSAELIQEYGMKLNPNNLCESLNRFRINFGKLADRLEPSRTKYGVKRAADEYFAVFQGLAS